MAEVYSILVSYNPNISELNQAVDRLLLQTKRVIVCNNSDFSVEFNHQRVKVFNFYENLGIAKAQNIGMKWAFENGAEFILQIDQDSIPDSRLVKNLLACHETLTKLGYKIGLVGSQDYDKDTNELSVAKVKKGRVIEGTSYIKVDQVLSSGSLIPFSTYNCVGGMDDGLFIDAVDSEYCWRTAKFGYLVVKDPSSLMAHKLGEGKKKILGFAYVGVPAPVRHYYQVRNFFLLCRRDYAPLYWKASNAFKLVFKLVFYPFVLSDGKRRFYYMLKGVKHGFSARVGRFE
ncbi:glycosyltransferase family 2 protein [Modicisalibacter luteus]|nr:glycosyltransferase family 2 protein [Halomonas lutea]